MILNHYRAGHGEPLVLIHGIGSRWQMWEPVIDRLVAQRDVLALDHESRKLAEEFQRAQSRLSHARLELEKLSSSRVKLKENVERDRAAERPGRPHRRYAALPRFADLRRAWPAHHTHPRQRNHSQGTTALIAIIARP